MSQTGANSTTGQVALAAWPFLNRLTNVNFRSALIFALTVCSSPVWAQGEKSINELRDALVALAPGDVDPYEAELLSVTAHTMIDFRSEEHTSELQSHSDLVCRLLLEKKKKWQAHNRMMTTTTY